MSDSKFVYCKTIKIGGTAIIEVNGKAFIRIGVERVYDGEVVLSMTACRDDPEADPADYWKCRPDEEED